MLTAPQTGLNPLKVIEMADICSWCRTDACCWGRMQLLLRQDRCIVLARPVKLVDKHLFCTKSRHLAYLSSRQLSCFNRGYVSCHNRWHLSCPDGWPQLLAASGRCWLLLAEPSHNPACWSCFAWKTEGILSMPHVVFNFTKRIWRWHWFCLNL